MGDNPPAFPRTGEGFGNSNYDTPGMSLRDWFAGQALAGLLSDSDNIARHSRMVEGHLGSNLRTIAAAFAYQYADAMLAERERGLAVAHG